MMLDLRKMDCPVPYMKCKEFLEENPGEVLECIVSDEMECMNLKTLARGLGYSSTYDVYEDGYKFTFKGLVELVEEKSERTQVLALGSDVMGSGDIKLGKLLIHNYLLTLSKSEVIPNTIVMYNSGVLLATTDANCVLALQELEQRGTMIYLCKTCLDFYNCLDQLAVGHVSNMVTINDQLMSHDKVIHI